MQSSSENIDGAEYNRAKGRFNELLEQEEIFWKRRVKCHWLEGGDSNTRFFHAMLSSGKRLNKIVQLRDNSGVWVTTQAATIFPHYLHQALFHMHLDNSPGPDGLNPAVAYGY